MLEKNQRKNISKNISNIDVKETMNIGKPEKQKQCKLVVSEKQS